MEIAKVFAKPMLALLVFMMVLCVLSGVDPFEALVRVAKLCVAMSLMSIPFVTAAIWLFTERPPIIIKIVCVLSFFAVHLYFANHPGGGGGSGDDPAWCGVVRC